MSAEKTYSYTNTWRLRNVTSSPERVMQIFKEGPTQVFPFPMKCLESTKSKIERGAHYYLFPLFIRKEPVMVDDETTTSFRFNSLPGHWHGTDATIKFTVLNDNQGQVYLQQHAEFPRKWYSPAADLGSKVVWFAQAKRLSHQVRKVEKHERS
jgi:hypothetical protein